MSAERLATLVLVLGVVWILTRVAAGQNRKPLPPSCLIDSFRYRWESYASNSTILGPVISAPSLGGTSVIVLNTAETLLDLLDKNAVYACRPRWPMVELLGRQNNIGFTYYNDRLRKMRKVLQAPLSPTSVSKDWCCLLDSYSIQLCCAIEEHKDIYNDVQAVIQQLIGAFSYGHEPDSSYLELAKAVAHQTGEALQPGRWLVNSYPALMWIPKWMPYATFQKWAQKAKRSYEEMVRIPFEAVKKSTEHGEYEHCLVQRYLKLNPHRSKEDDLMVMYAAGSLFSAGTETLSAVILNFLNIIASHHDIQDQIYKEIVNVIGHNTLPLAPDILNLPYLQDVIKEVHRVHPAVPLVPHSNTCEQEYLGYRIPKRSWVMGNIWAVLHDRSLYHEPHKFMPSRYQHDKAPDPRKFIYGFGRRRCPGASFADQFLMLVIARIATLFEINPINEDMNDAMDFTAGLVAFPKGLLCSLVPRPGSSSLLQLAVAS